MRGNDAFSPSYKARKWAHGLLMNGRKEKQGSGGKRGMKAGWRRKKWRKEKLGRVSEREREKGEKFGEWRLASGKVELPFRLEGKRYLVVSCSKIVEKGSKKLARV